MLITASIGVLLGVSMPLTNTITVYQSLLCLVLLNVNLPKNLRVFLELFRVGLLEFLLNPVDWFLDEHEQIQGQATLNFQKQGFDGIFLKTCGNLIFIMTVFLSLHLSCSFLAKKHRPFKVLKERLGINLIIRLILCSSIQMLISIILQFQSLVGPKSRSTLNLISGVLTIGFSTAYIQICFHDLKIFLKSRDLKPKEVEALVKANSFLYDGFFTHTTIKLKLRSTIVIIKGLLSMLLMVVLNHMPLLQVFMQIVIIVIYQVLLYFVHLYTNSRDQWWNYFNEYMMMWIHVLMIIFPYKFSNVREEHEGKLTLGWVIIAMCAIVIIIIHYRDLRVVFKAFLSLFKAITITKSPKKVKFAKIKSRTSRIKEKAKGSKVNVHAELNTSSGKVNRFLVRKEGQKHLQKLKKFVEKKEKKNLSSSKIKSLIQVKK